MKTLLVTPSWMDSHRLEKFGAPLSESLAQAQLPIRWLIADDGSDEEERQRLHQLCSHFKKRYPETDLCLSPRHLGKGGIIRFAWESCHDCDWLAFCDADGSINAETILKMIRKAHAVGLGHAVIASRRLGSKQKVCMSLKRKIPHHIFALTAGRIFSIRYSDTQCGAKIVTAQDYRLIQSLLHENGFAFDIELLLALEKTNTRVIEFPVEWVEQPEGHTHVLRDGFRLLLGLWRIRKRFNKG